jgi:hypothetical protein
MHGRFQGSQPVAAWHFKWKMQQNFAPFFSIFRNPSRDVEVGVMGVLVDGWILYCQNNTLDSVQILSATLRSPLMRY